MGGPVNDAGGARVTGREAWEQFVKASYPAVWRLCAALVDQATAEDLAQETFLRATRALPAFRRQASTRTWILSIARRVCMDELRGEYRRDRRNGRIVAAANALASVPDASGEVAMRELLEALEPDRRAAFVLTQLFRFSYDEAAVICGCPTGTIRSRVARARDQLIGLLGGGQVSRPRQAAE